MEIVEVKRQLNSYRNSLHDLKTIIRYINELHDKSTATGSLAPKQAKVVASLPSGAKFEDIIIQGVDLQNVLEKEAAALEEIKTEVLDLISYANTSRSRLILTEFYINCKTNYEIASVMHYEPRAIYKIKRKAIRQIANKI